MIYDRCGSGRKVNPGEPARVGLMHRAKPVGRALIMHDVSELRPLGFMVPYMRGVLHNSSLAGWKIMRRGGGEPLETMRTMRTSLS